jgi:hypothetical protein
MAAIDSLTFDDLTVDSLQQAMKRLESRFLARAASRPGVAGQQSSNDEMTTASARPAAAAVSFHLFNARAGEQRPYLKDVALTLSGTHRIRYRGQELRSDDYAVWSQLLSRINSVTYHPPGYLEFTPCSILRTLGWRNTSHDRARLRDCLERMQATALCLLGPNAEHGMSMSLIAKYGWIQATSRSPGRWRVWIDTEILALFNEHSQELAPVSESGVMAQWLRQLYANYVEPYPRRLEKLHQLCPLPVSPETFREQLENALEALAKDGFLSSYQIDSKDLVHVQKSHKKHH